MVSTSAIHRQYEDNFGSVFSGRFFFFCHFLKAHFLIKKRETTLLVVSSPLPSSKEIKFNFNFFWAEDFINIEV